MCSLSFYDASDDKKHEREENVVARGKREFFIFHTLACKKNKKQKKRHLKLVRFFGPAFFAEKERQKRDRIFFKTKASFFPSSSSHIISITVSFVVSLCHVQKTTNRESFCE